MKKDIRPFLVYKVQKSTIYSVFTDLQVTILQQSTGRWTLSIATFITSAHINALFLHLNSSA